MKTKDFCKYLCAFTLLLGGALMTSCIEDGEETIALESGDATELILGSWQVMRSELYDPTTQLYHSDMPEDNMLDAIYTFEEQYVGELAVEDAEAEAFEWSMDDYGERLVVDGTRYQIASLGASTMVWTSSRVVNDEAYTHHYILNKVEVTDEPEEDFGDNATQIITSEEGATFRRSGYTVVVPKGAVPRNSSGGVGQVALSFQMTDEMPAALPAGTTLMEQGNIKLEPMNFTFNSPLTVNIPLRGAAAHEVNVYRYDAYAGAWRQVPVSKINADGTVSITVLELGQFIVVKNTNASGDNKMTTGGIHIAKKHIQSGYYYYLTLTPQNASSSSRSIAFTNGEDLYMAGVPTGNYTASVTRERRNATTSEATSTESANLGTVKVTNTLTKGSGGYSTYTGWTEVSLANVSWSTGRPKDWGEATVTYGTGKFQATLTWVNVEGSVTDYDLHLTTPNGEVYFSQKRLGSFELDRDWTSPLGNAIENIYSISDDFASGTYKVRVHHFSGATGKRYNCRIIVDGMVVKSVTDVVDSGYDAIYTFTVE